jgi:quercetin dioxygenase-like cupin family protein
MFTRSSAVGYKPVLPGIELRTLAYGAKTLLAEFRLAQGSKLPRHSHPHEQTGYLVSGRMRLTIGRETVEVGPGDSWCIASGIEHEAEIVETAVAIEVFSPVREDYLPDFVAKPNPPKG